MFSKTSYRGIYAPASITAPAPPPTAENKEDPEESEEEEEEEEKDDILPPDYQAELDEAAAPYHNDDLSPFNFAVRASAPPRKDNRRKIRQVPIKVGFLGAIKQAREQGKNLGCFPVIWGSSSEEAPV